MKEELVSISDFHDRTMLILRLDAGIDDGNSSSSSLARFLPLALVAPLFAADMLGRNGELVQN